MLNLTNLDFSTVNNYHLHYVIGHLQILKRDWFFDLITNFKI